MITMNFKRRDQFHRVIMLKRYVSFLETKKQSIMTITSNLFRKVWKNIKCNEIKFRILLIRAAKLGRNLKHTYENPS